MKRMLRNIMTGSGDKKDFPAVRYYPNPVNLSKSVRLVAFMILCLTFLFFSYLMILITLQYIPVDFKAAFLGIKQDEIALPHYKLAFFTHVYSSIIVHLTGALQFSGYMRKKYSRLHKSLGFIYIGLILLAAAPSGLVMSYYANGGLVAQVSFCTLTLLWFAFTGKALWDAKQKNWISHRNYMIRSYALTLSAVSLRIFKYGIANLFTLPPMDTYQIVSIAGWTINLLLAEWIIRSFLKNKL